ncbi:hypothetical protein BpHYR1_028420 [Brachionus plicatilis]|uniref:Uncharacterized protein n=1 Tax=Brachionus plicatilis TaxID=10195 RepID=A0A3M7S2J0_BRAPC|nr:hypothetical protein BpHYR1_028420 [Brachionus plicatilis]
MVEQPKKGSNEGRKEGKKNRKKNKKKKSVEHLPVMIAIKNATNEFNVLQPVAGPLCTQYSGHSVENLDK